MGALVSGAVLLPAAPALADVNAQPGSLTLNPGEEKSITVTLSGDEAADPEATFSVSGLGNDVTLRGPGGCSPGGGGLQCNENAFDQEGLTQRVTVTVAAKNPSSVQAGQSKEGSISVEAGGDDDAVNVTLRGPQQAAGATEVTGKVVDTATGDGIGGVSVTLKDSTGSTLTGSTSNSGNYSIRPSGNRTIAAGQVTVTATKEGYADQTATGNAQAGRALANLNIRMKPVTASAEPSTPASADTPSEVPSANASDGGVANTENTSGESDGPSMLSWVLIGMGVLLVLLGIGAIVLLVMRRKDESEGDDADNYGSGPNQPVPAAGGAYRGDPTMVGGRSSMHDQTAIVGPQQLDEFPDPYAAPAPAPTRVGGAYSGGYNEPQPTSVAPGYGPGGDDYGNGGGYRDERGYGAQQGGYGDQPRGGGYGPGGGGYADQPTGVYQGGANGSEYGANGSNYGGGGANGYGGGGGYAAGGAANGGGANGYGPGGGAYEDEYGRPAGQGYPAAGGYDGGDYAGDQRNGRGRNDWQA